jgi:hypothetical protein
VTQTYELRFPNDEAAARAQAMLAEKVAAANGTMRVAPGFCYGLAYLVVQLPDEADLDKTLYPFVQHWQIVGMRYSVELDSRVTDEEVELTAQDIADEAHLGAFWKSWVRGEDDIPDDEPLPPEEDTGGSPCGPLVAF